ncbi:MAG: single-stranded DNA-binding protein [Candidatus Levybacteria bacterium]|nr:single-stranded DNA-binding protein [Candidatus Levybacteria bacterium]
MARSLNRVQLIGNLTRDPELRYTPTGAAVVSFGLATNRTWKTDTGEKHDETEFHNIVAWNKLAELCSQFLTKGRKIYVEGRLATRSWTAQDGAQKSRTEIVIDDMILLDSQAGYKKAEVSAPTEERDEGKTPSASSGQATVAKKKVEPKKEVEPVEEDVMPDDIPF